MVEINFNPYTANVLDYVGKPLVNIYAEKVLIQQRMNGSFMIFIDDKLAEDGLSNIAASSVLNRMQCHLA